MNGLYLHPFFLLKDNQNKNLKERFFLLVYALLLVYMLLKSKILKSSMRLLATRRLSLACKGFALDCFPKGNHAALWFYVVKPQAFKKYIYRKELFKLWQRRCNFFG